MRRLNVKKLANAPLVLLWLAFGGVADLTAQENRDVDDDPALEHYASFLGWFEALPRTLPEDCNLVSRLWYIRAAEHLFAYRELSGDRRASINNIIEYLEQVASGNCMAEADVSGRCEPWVMRPRPNGELERVYDPDACRPRRRSKPDTQRLEPQSEGVAARTELIAAQTALEESEATVRWLQTELVRRDSLVAAQYPDFEAAMRRQMQQIEELAAQEIQRLQQQVAELQSQIATARTAAGGDTGAAADHPLDPRGCWGGTWAERQASIILCAFENDAVLNGVEMTQFGVLLYQDSRSRDYLAFEYSVPPAGRVLDVAGVISGRLTVGDDGLLRGALVFPDPFGTLTLAASRL